MRTYRSQSTLDPSQPFALVAVLGWLAIGGLAMACLPHARPGIELGATLPFWLVGALLLGLPFLTLYYTYRGGIWVRWDRQARQQAVKRIATAK